ncbi:hypothetical protein MTO96_012340 [Rhipicephalus appendiculatus]
MPTDGIAELDCGPRMQDGADQALFASFVPPNQNRRATKALPAFLLLRVSLPLCSLSIPPPPTTITERRTIRGGESRQEKASSPSRGYLPHVPPRLLPWRRGSWWCSGARAPVFSPRGQDGAVRCRPARWRRHGEEETRDWGARRLPEPLPPAPPTHRRYTSRHRRQARRNGRMAR